MFSHLFWISKTTTFPGSKIWDFPILESQWRYQYTFSLDFMGWTTAWKDSKKEGISPSKSGSEGNHPKIRWSIVGWTVVFGKCQKIFGLFKTIFHYLLHLTRIYKVFKKVCPVCVAVAEELIVSLEELIVSVFTQLHRSGFKHGQ